MCSLSKGAQVKGHWTDDESNAFFEEFDKFIDQCMQSYGKTRSEVWCKLRELGCILRKSNSSPVFDNAILSKRRGVVYTKEFMRSLVEKYPGILRYDETRQELVCCTQHNGQMYHCACIKEDVL